MLLAASMFVPHADAWSATTARGAYLRAMAIMHRPIPAMVFGIEPQSVAFAVATAAASAVGSSLCCSAYPQKSGSMCSSATPCPTLCNRKRQSAK